MSFLRKLGETGLWLVFAVFFALGVREMYFAMKATDPFSVIFCVLVATAYFLCGGLAIAGLVAERIGYRFGAILVYPRSLLKSPEKRLAAAESLAVKHDYEGARLALDGILREEPRNLAAGLAMAKLLLKVKGLDEGRAEACALLMTQLSASQEPPEGASDVALFLVDLLEESGLHQRAVNVLEAELGKSYCRAEASLLRKRLDVLSA